MTNNLVLGAAGEKHAAESLIRLGYEFVQQNWRGSKGEIDLIMCQGSELIFIEVKTRSTNRFGDPVLAVGTRKLRRMRALAIEWMEENEVRAQWRVDVIGLVGTPDSGFDFWHIRGL